MGQSVRLLKQSRFVNLHRGNVLWFLVIITDSIVVNIVISAARWISLYLLYRVMKVSVVFDFFDDILFRIVLIVDVLVPV